MTDYLTLGSSPYDEDCAQVGSENYRQQAMQELTRFKNLMLKVHPETTQAYYRIKSFPHDFGTYHELCVIYDPDDEAQCAWAFDAESKVPSNWS